MYINYKIEAVIEKLGWLSLEIYSIYLWEKYVIKKSKGKVYSFFKIIYILIRNFCYSNKSNSQKYDIAFFSFLSRDGDFGIIYPIVNEFDNSNKKSIYFLTEECLRDRKEELKKLKNIEVIDIRTARNRLSIFELKTVLKDTQKIFNEILKIDKALRKERVYILLVILSNLLTSYQISKKYKNIDRFLSLGSPDVKLIAKDRKVYAIQHGFFNSYEPNYPWFYSFNVDKVYIFGKKDMELRTQYKDVEFIVSGAPNYDKIRDDILLSEKVKNIYFFSNLQEREILIEEVCSFLNYISKIDGINIKVKLHPNENFEIYKKYKNKLNDLIEVIERKSILDIISDVDIAITIDSTSNLEMLLNKKITCQLLLNEFSEDIHIEEQKFSKKIKTKEEGKKFIESLKSKEFLKKTFKEQFNILEEYYLSNIGQASKFIYKDIINDFENRKEKKC